MFAGEEGIQENGGGAPAAMAFSAFVACALCPPSASAGGSRLPQPPRVSRASAEALWAEEVILLIQVPTLYRIRNRG